MSWSYNPDNAETLSVWAIPRSLATTYGITFVFFSSRYLDVSVPWVRLRHCRISFVKDGLSHSDICGSIRICQSPQLFAAYHVLLRLKEPRHSPYALNYFLLLCLNFTVILVFPICQRTLNLLIPGYVEYPGIEPVSFFPRPTRSYSLFKLISADLKL